MTDDRTGGPRLPADDRSSSSGDPGGGRMTLHTEGGAADTSWQIVNGVGRVTGTPVEKLPALVEFIDPDALDVLFDTVGNEGTSTRGTVSFQYAGCTVAVWSDGRVVIERHGLRSEA